MILKDETSLFSYTQEVLWRHDKDFDGKIGVDEPFSASAQWFMDLADSNRDRYVDRFELQHAIAFRIDRDFDRRISKDERRDAWIRFDFPY